MNEYSSFKSFSDIDKKLSASSNVSDVRNMERDNHQSNKRNEKKRRLNKMNQHIMIVRSVKKMESPTIALRQKRNGKTI